MIISCKECDTNFRLEQAIIYDIALKGRHLKCSSCDTEWREGPYNTDISRTQPTTHNNTNNSNHKDKGKKNEEDEYGMGNRQYNNGVGYRDIREGDESENDEDDEDEYDEDEYEYDEDEYEEEDIDNEETIYEEYDDQEYVGDNPYQVGGDNFNNIEIEDDIYAQNISFDIEKYQNQQLDYDAEQRDVEDEGIEGQDFEDQYMEKQNIFANNFGSDIEDMNNNLSDLDNKAQSSRMSENISDIDKYFNDLMNDINTSGQGDSSINNIRGNVMAKANAQSNFASNQGRIQPDYHGDDGYSDEYADEYSGGDYGEDESEDEYQSVYDYENNDYNSDNDDYYVDDNIEDSYSDPDPSDIIDDYRITTTIRDDIKDILYQSETNDSADDDIEAKSRYKDIIKFNFLSGLKDKKNIVKTIILTVAAVILLIGLYFIFLNSKYEPTTLITGVKDIALITNDNHHDIKIREINISNFAMSSNKKLISFNIEGLMVNTSHQDLKIPNIYLSFLDKNYTEIHSTMLNVPNYLISKSGKLRFTNRVSKLSANTAYIKFELGK